MINNKIDLWSFKLNSLNNTKLIISHILSQYFDNENLEFSQNEYGKPFLKYYPAFKFNWSHSLQDGILAIGFDADIGIDIEHQRTIDTCSIAKRFFSERENALLIDSLPYFQLFNFFKIWVQKEALLKALGTGFISEKQQLCSIQPVEPWQIKSFMFKPGCHLGLCTNQPIKEINFYTYELDFNHPKKM